jgi:putative acetyltransferase
MLIRQASSADIKDVLSVQQAAFGSDEEANLVRDLLDDPTAAPTLSLLAFEDDLAAGHILFTSAYLESETSLKIAILAPLAVVPVFQNRGIGASLIRHGLNVLGESKTDLVFVLGYPRYYQRHGFKPAGVLGYHAPYPIPEKNADAWMVRELSANVIGNFHGKVRCAHALDKPAYWHE